MIGKRNNSEFLAKIYFLSLNEIFNTTYNLSESFIVPNIIAVRVNFKKII